MIKKYFPVLLIIAIHAAFFGYAVIHESIYLKDSYEYLNCAKNILTDLTIYSGDLEIPFDAYLVSLRPPAYGAFIALLQLFSESHLLICLAQNILSILTYLLLIKISKILFQTNYTYLITFLFIFFPSQYVYANMIMSEILFQFLLISFFYFNVLFYNRGEYKFFFYANAVMCLLLLTKPIAIVLFVAYILFVVYLVYKKEINFRLLVYPLIGILCLSTYQFYNYKKTGYYHYSSISSTYLLNYQLYPTLLRSVSAANQSDPEDTEHFAQNIIKQINDSAEKEKNFKGYSKKRVELTLIELKKYKPIFLLLSTQGMFNFFIDAGSWDLKEFFGSTYYSNEKTNNLMNQKILAKIYLLLIVCINITLFLLLLYSITQLTSYNKLLALALLIIFAVMLSTGLNGTARFKLPVYPLIIIASIYSLKKPRIKDFLEKF